MEATVWERRPPAPSAVEHALDGVRDACFWIEDAPGARYEPLASDHITDLAVVGGGYAGLWTAVRAKQRDPGRRVLLLEAHQLGWAASGRNGGFCEASVTHGEENGRSRWPDEYDELVRLGDENLDGIEQTVREHDLDVDFERTGELAVAVEPHEAAWLEEMTEGRFLDEAAVRAEVASPTYLAGRLLPGCALVHPAKLVAELGRLATTLGVEIVEGTPVESLDAEGRTGSLLLHTPRGRVTADRVALATNVFPSLVRRHRPFTVPVYDYAVMTEPLSSSQLDAIGWRTRQGIGDLANQFHYYRLSADNRILFDGYDAVYRFG